MNMSRFVTAALHSFFVAVSIGCTSHANADIERSQELIRTIPVQGVTLSMTPRQAFAALTRSGYTAGNIETFEDWRSGAIEMVRGNTSGADGKSQVVLGRIPGHLINIYETTNKPNGERIDYEQEIADAKTHFGIGDDARDCTVNTRRRAGVCTISDGNNDRPFAYGIQVRPTMRMVQLGYGFEPTVGLDD